MIVDSWEQRILGDYGTFTAGPARIVGHCTDGPWGSVGFQLSAKKAHYHCLVIPRPRAGEQRRTIQTCRLDRSCGGMKQPVGGPTTNKRTAIQWSIAGPASEMHTLTEEECRWIGGQLAPILRFYPSVSPEHRLSVGPGDHTGPIATKSWSGRYTAAEWNSFGGWTQHQRAPGNDHYDIYFHEDQFQLVIDTAHGGDDLSAKAEQQVDDLWRVLVGNRPAYEGDQTGAAHDLASRIIETAHRVGADRSAVQLAPKDKTIGQVVPTLDQIRTVVAQELAKVPPPSSGGATPAQIATAVADEIYRRLQA